MNSRFAIIVIVIIVGFFGLIVFNRKDASAPDGANNVQPTSNIKGEGSKGVTLVEYGDFQCPACAAYYPIIEQVFEQRKEDITFQFRNFPLSQIHPNAVAAHRAAEAAANQDKYFEMYDLLYQGQQSWASVPNPAQVFETYATQIGLDVPRYKTDLASAEVNARVNADIRAGQQEGIASTPVFMLDGKKLDQPPQDVEGFNKLIDEAIAAKNQ